MNRRQFARRSAGLAALLAASGRGFAQDPLARGAEAEDPFAPGADPFSPEPVTGAIVLPASPAAAFRRPDVKPFPADDPDEDDPAGDEPVATLPPDDLPSGGRAPFGWPAFAAYPAGPRVPGWGTTTLRFPPLPEGRRTTDVAAVRFALAMGAPAAGAVGVHSPVTGSLRGAVDVRFAPPLQLFSVPLSSVGGEAALREGLALRVVGGPETLWVLGAEYDSVEIEAAVEEADAGALHVPLELRPHLLVLGADDAWTEFFRRLDSLATLQPFGWREGAVLDGLLDLAALPERAALRETARRHLALFLTGGPGTAAVPPPGPLAPPGATLADAPDAAPFAALARLAPDHPLLDALRQRWLAGPPVGPTPPAGPVPPGAAETSAAAGLLAVAYPMAALGRARGNEELTAAALRALRSRLADPEGGDEDDPAPLRVRRRMLRLLGAARTLAAVGEREDAADLVAAFRRLADAALNRFMSEEPFSAEPADGSKPAPGPGLTNAVGVAAAWAIGVKAGWLGEEHAAAADAVREALTDRLTPDGFLFESPPPGGPGGVALDTTAMGLAAQLIAARETTPAAAPAPVPLTEPAPAPLPLD
ncbi:hypothetical protein [Alienimonas sp. DA493]|uniref:hypothetical protein n=1 Tax=Alienimonas sp. DA493 TaxID=3373605 RepID=UPI003754BEB2